MNVGRIKIKRLGEKKDFFNDTLNIQEDTNHCTKDFTPLCIDVNKNKYLKITAQDLIKKGYNNDSPVEIKVILQIEIDD